MGYEPAPNLTRYSARSKESGNLYFVMDDHEAHGAFVGVDFPTKHGRWILYCASHAEMWRFDSFKWAQKEGAHLKFGFCSQC